MKGQTSCHGQLTFTPRPSQITLVDGTEFYLDHLGSLIDRCVHYELGSRLVFGGRNQIVVSGESMHIAQVEAVLGELSLVPLRALVPDRVPYELMLLQPGGPIEGSMDRIGHADSEGAAEFCAKFLERSLAANADLVVTPEYCLPWTVVGAISATDSALVPEPGGLWVLGCESITPDELDTLAAKMRGAGHFVHYEPLENLGNAGGRYVDPLVYVFWARVRNGTERLCFLIQFKTYACRDKLDIEITSLRTGNVIYRFGDGMQAIRLLTLICSDAFQCNDAIIQQEHANCLLLHLQLNPKPADSDYARYRAQLMAVGSRSRVELLCLNWAAPVSEKDGDGKLDDWKNNSGSALYVPPDGYRPQDSHVVALHRAGIYYCLSAKRAGWHTFYLNCAAHALLLQKEKVVYQGPRVLEPQFCLQVSGRWGWNGAWVADMTPDDGFAGALKPYPALPVPFQALAAECPLAVERTLEMLTLPEDKTSDWHVLERLGALQVALPESIRMVTVEQEPDPNSKGRTFRKLRLERAQGALTLPGAGVPWPGGVAELEHGFAFTWTAAEPHRNVIATKSGKRATVIFLGDESDDNVIDAAFKFASQHVRHKAFTDAEAVGANVQDAVDKAGNRVCVIYRRNHVLTAKGASQFYTRSPDASAVDIAGDTDD